MLHVHNYYDYDDDDTPAGAVSRAQLVSTATTPQLEEAAERTLSLDEPRGHHSEAR